MGWISVGCGRMGCVGGWFDVDFFVLGFGDMSTAGMHCDAGYACMCVFVNRSLFCGVSTHVVFHIRAFLGCIFLRIACACAALVDAFVQMVGRFCRWFVRTCLN